MLSKCIGRIVLHRFKWLFPVLICPQMSVCVLYSLPQATLGGAAIATGIPVPLRRSPTRKQNRPELSKSCIESLSKGFLNFSSAEEYVFILAFLKIIDGRNCQDYHQYYLYLVWKKMSENKQHNFDPETSQI